jgi:hypothetical protein
MDVVDITATDQFEGDHAEDSDYLPTRRVRQATSTHRLGHQSGSATPSTFMHQLPPPRVVEDVSDSDFKESKSLRAF